VNDYAITVKEMKHMNSHKMVSIALETSSVTHGEVLQSEGARDDNISASLMVREVK